MFIGPKRPPTPGSYFCITTPGWSFVRGHWLVFMDADESLSDPTLTDSQREVIGIPLAWIFGKKLRLHSYGYRVRYIGLLGSVGSQDGMLAKPFSSPWVVSEIIKILEAPKKNNKPGWTAKMNLFDCLKKNNYEFIRWESKGTPMPFVNSATDFKVLLTVPILAEMFCRWMGKNHQLEISSAYPPPPTAIVNNRMTLHLSWASRLGGSSQLGSTSHLNHLEGDPTLPCRLIRLTNHRY